MQIKYNKTTLTVIAYKEKEFLRIRIEGIYLKSLLVKIRQNIKIIFLYTDQTELKKYHRIDYIYLEKKDEPALEGFLEKVFPGYMFI